MRVAGLAKYDLEIANRLYFNSAEEVRQCMKDIFDDELEVVDFASDSQAARDRINNWVSELTRGNIRDLATPDNVNVNTRMALVSSRLHFTFPLIIVILFQENFTCCFVKIKKNSSIQWNDFNWWCIESQSLMRTNWNIPEMKCRWMQPISKVSGSLSSRNPAPDWARSVRLTRKRLWSKWCSKKDAIASVNRFNVGCERITLNQNLMQQFRRSWEPLCWRSPTWERTSVSLSFYPNSSR